MNFFIFWGEGKNFGLFIKSKKLSRNVIPISLITFAHFIYKGFKNFEKNVWNGEETKIYKGL